MYKYINKGSILLDIILALSLSMIFIVIITQSSFVARDMFDKAVHRHTLINLILHASSTQYSKNNQIDNFTSTTSFLYGNDRILIDVTNQDFKSKVFFSYLKPKDVSDLIQSIGTPLCSTDFFNHNPVGSYSKIYSVANMQEYFNTKQYQPNISITPISLPINPLLPLTDIQVRNNIAYISADSAKVSDPDLLVIDFKDRSSPKIRNTIDTGPGISAISLVGNRVFAAVTSTVGQLQSIRLDNLNSSTLENIYRLPLPQSSTTPTRGSAIFFYDNTIYLGTEKWDGNEFNMINVINPLDPVYIGGFETGTKINDILVTKNVVDKNLFGKAIAYVADSDQQQLRMIDVTNTQNPLLLNSFSPSGWSRQEGNVVSMFENGLSFGRTSGGFDVKNDPEIFLLGSTTLTATQSLNIPGGIYGIIQDKFHVYVASREIDKEFQIYDRTLSISSVMTFSLPVAPQRLTCDGDHVYVLSATAPVIYEIYFN